MDEIKDIKRFIWRGIGIIILLSVVVGTCNYACNTAKKATHAEDAVIVYEEFQEIYNTCNRLNTDLGNMQNLPETDKMFEQFSKAQRVNTIKTNLNRWITDYNAKSKMWGRSLWKSSSLPYQLDVNQFSNYNK